MNGIVQAGIGGLASQLLNPQKNASITRVENGYVIYLNGKQYVCKLLNEMGDMIVDYFEDKPEGKEISEDKQAG